MIKSIFRRTVALICTLILTLSVFTLSYPAVASAAVAKPAQVKGLKATAGTTYVTLTWTKLSKNTDYAVFSYNPETAKYKVLANVSDNTYEVKNLDASTTYYFAVQAYNTDADKRYYGEVSKNVKVTTKSATPTQVKNLAVSTSNVTSIKLKWTKITDAKYVVYFYDSTTKKYTKIAATSTNSYTVKNLKAETEYIFAVRAYKTVKGKNYYGSYSAKLKATTAPTAITLKQARSLFENARKVYMDWVYSCNYISYDRTITREFYGMPCQFAAVEHDTVKDKSDIVSLLNKYFEPALYENELYLYLELDGRLYGKLYYYAEGGKSDTDTLTRYYTDSLKKVSGTKFQYTLYPVYYSSVKNENLPESYTYTIVRKDGRWVFDDIFYPCCAEIRTTS